MLIMTGEGETARGSSPKESSYLPEEEEVLVRNVM